MNNDIKATSWTIFPALVTAVVVMIIAAAWFGMPVTDAKVADVVVYKTAYCECCVKWVEHLRKNGFDVSVVDVPSTKPTHRQLGIPRQLGSCHTATVGDYWVEGHVPADLIEQLLAEQPDEILGIATPGMPMGSPGMEGPNPVEYQILAYGNDGKVTVYATRQGRVSAE